MNALIDTCVIIDAMQSRKPFDEDAEAVFLSVANHRCEGFLRQYHNGYLLPNA